MSPVRLRQRDRRTSRPRPGFTLIELIMVTVIIAALIAILLPAVAAVRFRVIQSGVKTDIMQMEQAVAQFKGVFGVEPPSRLVLCESPADWAGNDPMNARLTTAQRQRSQAFIRRMWPQFNFSLTRDINGNGTTTDVLDLTAGECFVFFIGGARWNSGDSRFDAVGFSKNPSNPFVLGGNREGPFYQFDVNRFVDTDGDLMPEYVDGFTGQQTPLLYFSSYEGKGYDPLDWAGTAMDDPTHPELPNPYPPTGDDDGPYHLPNSSPGMTPYKYHNAQTFQIISPGADGQFGYGGVFDPADATASLGTRDTERDNITNFHGGPLDP